MMYDAGVYNPQDDDDEVEVCIYIIFLVLDTMFLILLCRFWLFSLQGFADFLDEMVSLMNDSREEVRFLFEFFYLYLDEAHA